MCCHDPIVRRLPFFEPKSETALPASSAPSTVCKSPRPRPTATSASAPGRLGASTSSIRVPATSAGPGKPVFSEPTGCRNLPSTIPMNLSRSASSFNA